METVIEGKRYGKLLRNGDFFLDDDLLQGHERLRLQLRCCSGYGLVMREINYELFALHGQLILLANGDTDVGVTVRGAGLNVQTWVPVVTDFTCPKKN